MTRIIAIDQSTSATKALLYDESGRCLDRESIAHKQFYPQPGWVEHDADEIWRNVLAACGRLLARHPGLAAGVDCVSLTNQRETITVFEHGSGEPLHPAIVWQCRRSEDICERHREAGDDELVQRRTGLRIDPYFSASKLQWLVENNDGLRKKLDGGEALIGTIDAYLVHRLTDGAVFATDHTNASRTLLFDIARLGWDEELCKLWDVPIAALPEIRESSAHFGTTTLAGLLERPAPICGVIGDSQAAMFSQRCFEPGTAKVTFGTGSSVLLNIGNQPKFSTKGVVTSLGWVHAGQPVYAFEGIIISSAATLDWLKNQLGLIADISEISTLASAVPDSAGVYLVPAFSGLGLPHWEADARAAIVGLSAHSSKQHVVRAAVESMTYQLHDALTAMAGESGVAITELRADGGPTANEMLMQFTADTTQVRISASAAPDCSALGAAFMGLLGTGQVASLDEVAALPGDSRVYEPAPVNADTVRREAGWHRAVRQVLAGVQD